MYLSDSEAIPPNRRFRNVDTVLEVPELLQEGSTIPTISTVHHPGGKGIKRCPDQATGRAFVFVNPNGESMISIVSGANSSLDTTRICQHEKLFEQCDYYLIQSEVPVDAVTAAAKIAHRHHTKTILKPSSVSLLPDKVLANIDILVPNEKELESLQPGNDSMEEKAQKLLKRGVGCVIVTMGDRGSYLCSSTVEQYFASEDFTAVDDTGAGDAFISALTSCLLRNYTISQSISIASYAAGFSVSHQSVIDSLIDRLTLDSYINQMHSSESELLSSNRLVHMRVEKPYP